MINFASLLANLIMPLVRFVNENVSNTNSVSSKRNNKSSEKMNVCC